MNKILKAKKLDVFDCLELIEIKIKDCNKHIKFWKDKKIVTSTKEFASKQLKKWIDRKKDLLEDKKECDDCIIELENQAKSKKYEIKTVCGETFKMYEKECEADDCESSIYWKEWEVEPQYCYSCTPREDSAIHIVHTRKTKKSKHNPYCDEGYNRD